jgi:hypothetical protein
MKERSVKQVLFKVGTSEKEEGEWRPWINVNMVTVFCILVWKQNIKIVLKGE